LKTTYYYDKKNIIYKKNIVVNKKLKFYNFLVNKINSNKEK